MTKPHINDTFLFKLFAHTHGGYKALSLTLKYFKREELNND